MTGKRFICPKCGQKTGIAILYGYPSEEMFEQANRNEIILGGCARLIEDPDRQCLKCGHQWTKARR